jgi:DNA-binding LacI/PurR family transcriptional regulator
VQHLVAAGVRRPAVLDAPRVPSRRAGLLREAFAAVGTPVVIEHAAAVTTDAAGAATTRLLAGSGRPDAIIAFNDLMAIGVLAACRRAGVDVPGEVRVAGIDGLALGGLIAPTLTTLAVDFDAVASAALELATEQPAGNRIVAHHLLLRESA